MGARSLTRLALRDRANARGRKCAKWRQAGREGRRVMLVIRGRGGSLCTRQPQRGYWGL